MNRESFQENDKPDDDHIEATNFNDWRQFFNEDELTIAYQQSIKASTEEGGSNDEVLINIQTAAADGQKQEGLITSYLTNDDSDDSASDDNLKDVDLYSKVYMQQKDTIQR